MFGTRPGLRRKPSAGLQPVVRFVDRVEILIKAVGKTFFGPVIEVIGWVERDNVPGWKARAPTVPPPAAPPLLAARAPAPAPATPAAKKSAKVGRARRSLRPNDPIDDLLGADPIPWS